MSGADLEGPPMVDYGPAIQAIATAIDEGRLEQARDLARRMPRRVKRSNPVRGRAVAGVPKRSGEQREYTYRDLMRLFRRDGFVDRYTGLRLVVPPALRAISAAIPDAFPFHSNWKEGACHDAYWDLSATADHVTPVAAGGQDELENLVSTCMSVNAQKGSLSLSDLGWQLHPGATEEGWDGLSAFFLRRYGHDPSLRRAPYFKDWERAVRD